MTLRKICLMGCDDTTEIEVELTDAEVVTVQRIMDLVEAKREYGCQPSMEFCDQ